MRRHLLCAIRSCICRSSTGPVAKWTVICSMHSLLLRTRLTRSIICVRPLCLSCRLCHFMIAKRAVISPSRQASFVARSPRGREESQNTADRPAFGTNDEALKSVHDTSSRGKQVRVLAGWLRVCQGIAKSDAQST